MDCGAKEGPKFNTKMSWENLITIVQNNLLNSLSESSTYIQENLYSYLISGIFGEKLFEAQTGDGPSTISATPIFSVKSSDLLRLPKSGDKIIIRSKTYLVNHFREDGEGLIEIYLFLE